MGFSDTDLRRILFNENADEDDVPEVDENTVVTKPGDIWQLGRHRLMCGDSSELSDIRLLIGDTKIDYIFGGPPYFNFRNYSYWDNYDDYLSTMFEILKNCKSIMQDGGIITWHVSNISGKNLISHHSQLFENLRFQYIEEIIWLKISANFSVLKSMHITHNRFYYPAPQYEVILVYQSPGMMPKMTQEGSKYMANHLTNVWEICSLLNKMKTIGHPDAIPVELPYRCIQAYTGKDAFIFDPFGGSGTTLIAAEKAGRRAFILEKNPAFCDLIVKRWEDMSGQMADRIRNHSIKDA